MRAVTLEPFRTHAPCQQAQGSLVLCLFISDLKLYIKKVSVGVGESSRQCVRVSRSTRPSFIPVDTLGVRSLLPPWDLGSGNPVLVIGVHSKCFCPLNHLTGPTLPTFSLLFVKLRCHFQVCSSLFTRFQRSLPRESYILGSSCHAWQCLGTTPSLLADSITFQPVETEAWLLVILAL